MLLGYVRCFWRARGLAGCDVALLRRRSRADLVGGRVTIRNFLIVRWGVGLLAGVLGCLPCCYRGPLTGGDPCCPYAVGE